jgi:hypothetical protein
MGFNRKLYPLGSQVTLILHEELRFHSLTKHYRYNCLPTFIVYCTETIIVSIADVLVLNNKVYFHYCHHVAAFIGNTHESNQQIIRALGYPVKQVNDDIDYVRPFFTVP